MRRRLRPALAVALLVPMLAALPARPAHAAPVPAGAGILPVRDPFGATSAAASATAAPHLDYYGGPVLGEVRLAQVIYGAGSYAAETTRDAAPSVASFLGALLPSAYVSSLAEYDTTVPAVGGGPGTAQHIGPGVFLGRYAIAPSPARNGPSITDADIQAELTAQIDAGGLPAPQLDAAGQPSTAYAVFFRNGQRICSGTVCSLTSPGFCAYHSSFRLHGTGPMLAYSVHPDMAGFENRGCGPGDAFDLTTAALSHEVVEMVTDPAIGVVTVAAPPLAWDDLMHSGRGEAADICTDGYDTLHLDAGAFLVQQRWSNLLGACVTTGPVVTPPGPPAPSPLAPPDAGGTVLAADAGVERLVDTRPAAAVTPDAPLRIDPGVPGAMAVVLDVVATDVTAAGFVTVWPCDEPRPVASNVNSTPDRTVANLVTVAVHGDGGVCLHHSAGTAHLVVDRVAAYVAAAGPTAAGRLVAVTPSRALDTRRDERPFGAGEERVLDLAAVGVPGGASAAVVTITAVDAPADGWWAAWGAGPWPGTSNLNATAGAVTANQAIVPLDAGHIRLRSLAGGHVVVDVAGWFTGPTDTVSTAGQFHPVTPRRVLDTRSGEPVTDVVVDLGALAPAGPSAVVLNVTATETSAAGFATAYPAGVAPPLASILGFETGQTVPGHAVVATAAGRVAVHSNVATHLVVDVSGWYG